MFSNDQSSIHYESDFEADETNLSKAIVPRLKNIGVQVNLCQCGEDFVLTSKEDLKMSRKVK